MVDSFKDISFETAKTPEDLYAILTEKLGITMAQCQEALSKSLRERAGELVENIANVAPYNNYDKLLESPELIVAFLKDEATKPENWKIAYLDVEKDKLLKIVFENLAVDDGEILKGYTYINLNGKIQHAFTQVR